MPRMQLRPKDKETLDKIREIIEGTKILKTQDDLIYGRWDFVVVGPSSRTSSIIREGYAEQAQIYQSPVYLATLGNPSGRDEGVGISIEELIAGVPEEFAGMEVLQIDPLRPFSINSEKKGPSLKKALKETLNDYEDKNIAVIQTPDEKYWGISVLEYLNDFDRSFPDQVTEALRTGNLPLKGNFLNLNQGPGSKYCH